MKRRLVGSAVRLVARCEVSHLGYAGINAIKEALTEGFKASKDGFEVSIKLIAHPVFALTCMCTEKAEGVAVLTAALDLIKASIVANKGIFSVQLAPQVAKTEKDDDKDEDGSDSDGGSDDDNKSYKSESDPGEQDVGMGDLDEDQMKALQAIKVDDD